MRAHRLAVGLALVIALVLCGELGPSAADEKKDEVRKGTIVGVVTATDKNFVEVKADGEEKGRRYFPHIAKEGSTEKATLELLGKIPVGTRVKLDWLYAERPRVIKIEIIKKDDKK